MSPRVQITIQLSCLLLLYLSTIRFERKNVHRLVHTSVTVTNSAPLYSNFSHYLGYWLLWRIHWDVRNLWPNRKRLLNVQIGIFELARIAHLTQGVIDKIVICACAEMANILCTLRFVNTFQVRMDDAWSLKSHVHSYIIVMNAFAL